MVRAKSPLAPPSGNLSDLTAALCVPPAQSPFEGKDGAIGALMNHETHQGKPSVGSDRVRRARVGPLTEKKSGMADHCRSGGIWAPRWPASLTLGSTGTRR